jgi:hypothetical protein
LAFFFRDRSSRFSPRGKSCAGMARQPSATHAKYPGMRQSESFWNFCRAFLAEWFTAMSGILGVPLSIAAYFVQNDIAKLALALTAIACFIFASYRVWRAERLKVISLEGEIDASPLRIREIEAQEAQPAALRDQTEELRLHRAQREKENDPLIKAFFEKRLEQYKKGTRLKTRR